MIRFARNAEPGRRVFSLMVLLSCASTAAFCQSMEEAVLANLRGYDQVFLAGYTLDLTARKPTGIDDRLGYSTATINLSSDGVRQALRESVSASDALPYLEESGIGGRTANDEFIVAVLKETLLYIGPESGKIRRNPTTRLIRKDGSEAAPPRAADTMIEVHSPDSRDLLNLYQRHILAVGRGFSLMISEVTGVESGEAGRLIVKGRGTLFSEAEGEWTLVIDTGNDYLVESSTFTRSSAKRVDFSSTSRDPMGTELKLFGRGTFSFSDHRVDLRVNDYGLSEDARLLDTVDAGINDTGDYTGRTTIMDFRSIDSEGVPAIRRVSNVAR
jgi:hypothetical protein